MPTESPALRQEVLVTLSFALRAPAGQQTDRALKRVGRTTSDDPTADAIRSGMGKPRRANDSLEIPASDVEAGAALALLSPRQRLALLLYHGRHWDIERIGRALGVEDAWAEVQSAEDAVTPGLRTRLAWEIDHQLRTIEINESSDQIRRIALGLGTVAVGVAAILVFLALTQANIDRPDLIQMRPTGLLRVNAGGDITRLIEEQVSVAKVTPDNAVLYQFSGGPGVAGGSIWYSPGPGRRAGQLIPKTGGALGWVEPENLPFDASHRYGIAITADTEVDSSISTTTTYAIELVDPETGSISLVTELGESTGDGESSTGGIKPVFTSYGGDRALVWMMDAVALESLPSNDVGNCGEWLLYDLSGSQLSVDLPEPECDQDAVSLSVPTLSPDGNRVMWLETTGATNEAAPPREGWLSFQSTALRVLDLETGRRYSALLTEIDQPTFWTQYTMFSQQTGTLAIDSEDDVVVVSIGVWNPMVAVYNYTTFLVDLVGEQVETSVSDGPVTFGH